jgi:hypothetical protein
MQLSTLSSKIAFAEKKASENYTKLLTRYPKNIRVLRDYARFLDEVASDEKLAHQVSNPPCLFDGYITYHYVDH